MNFAFRACGLLVTTLLLANQVTGTCWFPDGKTEAPDRPCHPNQPYSACCGTQSDGSPAFCLANGLCMSDLKLSRGSCTDKTWNDPSCAQNCTHYNPEGGWGLTACANVPYWSCTSDCDNNNFSITIHDFKLSDAQISSYGINIETIFTAATPAAASGTGFSSTAAANPVSTTTGSCETTAASSSGGSGSQATIVGAVTGTILGAALIGALVLFFFERRRNGQLRKRLSNAENWYRGWAPNDVAAVANLGHGPGGGGGGYPEGGPPRSGGPGAAAGGFYGRDSKFNSENIGPPPPPGNPEWGNWLSRVLAMAQIPPSQLGHYYGGGGNHPHHPPTTSKRHEMDSGNDGIVQEMSSPTASAQTQPGTMTAGSQAGIDRGSHSTQTPTGRSMSPTGGGVSTGATSPGGMSYGGLSPSEALSPSSPTASLPHRH